MLDGELVANEVVDEAKKMKKGCMIFKVDYEKAYNSISWFSLFHMMELLGFYETWVSWMRICLESSTISILVNQSPTNEFIPSRELK